MLDTLYTGPLDYANFETELERVCPNYLDSLSSVYHLRSVLAYVEDDDYDAAKRFGSLALAVRERIAGERPGLDLVKTLTNLGTFHRETGSFPVAERYLRRAIPIAKEIGEGERQNRAERQLALVYEGYGDHERAVELLEQIVAASTERKDLETRADALRVLSNQWLQLKAYGPAKKAIQRIGDYYADNDYEAASVLLNLAAAYYGEKNYSAAERTTEQAIGLATPYNDPGLLCKLENLRSLCLLRAENLSAAESASELANRYAQATSDFRLLAQTLDNRAEILKARGKDAERLDDLRNAIATLLPGWNYSEEQELPSLEQLAASPYKTDLFVYLSDLAAAHADQDDLREALDTYGYADYVADQLRLQQGTTTGKLFWRETVRPVYAAAIELAYRYEDQESAFFFFERSKAVLLLESLLRAEVDGKLPTEEASELSRRNQRLLSLQRKQLVDSLADRRLTRAITGARDSLLDYRLELGDRYPAQRILAHEIPRLEAEVAARLQNDRVQLHYFVGEQYVYVIKLSGAGSQFIRLDTPARMLSGQIDNFLGYFTSASHITDDPAGYLAAAGTLHRSLVEPLHLRARQKLTIFPDGKLALIPFGALVTETATDNLATAPYLLREHPIAYAHSSMVLANQRQKGNGKALLFAPFIEGDNQLPQSAREITGVEQIFPGQSLIGLQASAADFLNRAANFGILHLSTHAFSSAPARILTATDSLLLTDIYGLRLDADLVTLSACESNLGALADGEGVLSLGRAFALAGASGVVASLWSLNDAATADIITDFYRRLAAGENKPAALSAAQLAYLEREDLPGYLKSPYYWAGLSYYGNDEGTKKPRGEYWWLWGLLVVAGVAGLYFGLSKNRG